MKAVILALLFSACLFNAGIFAQTYSAGGGLSVASARIGWGFGLNGVFEYRPEIHHAYRLNFRMIYSDDIHQDGYFPGFTYFLPGFEASFVYYPVKWAIEPYAGAGIGYFFPSVSGPNGNYPITPEGLISSNDVKSSYGLNALAGLKLSADTPISLFLEFKYNYLRPKVTHLFSDRHSSEGKLEASSMVTSLSIIFRI